MNDKSTFTLTTAASHSKTGAYRFYLDNYQVRTLKDHAARDGSTLRVMCWNIQNGMWSDQDNNYRNFVAWVKKYDPDVCVWCEGETIFSKSGDKVYGTNRILPREWAQYAAKYGHNYVSYVKGSNDNYPQVVTSKYPIEKVAEFSQIGTSSDYVQHRSGLFRINCNGRDVNFVSFHAFAHAYDPKYTSSADQETSAAAHEGDIHRQKEISWVCGQTVLNSAYSSQSNWLMMGDFNAVSSRDKNIYTQEKNVYKVQSETEWLLHDYILENTDLVDVISEWNPEGDFFSTINGDTKRIDFMYASPSMYHRIESAQVLIDSWTILSRDQALQDAGKGYFCHPSDHRPILVDFKMN